MTYEDKRQLMRDITLLDADHVPELLKIIFRQMPDSFATVIPRCIPARRLEPVVLTLREP
jgi:hypothetical protein